MSKENSTTLDQTGDQKAKSRELRGVQFNKPCLAGSELEFIADAINRSQLAGNGSYTRNCHDWLRRTFHSSEAFLTHSGTAALEMASLLADIQPGDEIIMPSFTFVSTASSFVLRGGVPVFIDVRPDTLNLDEQKIEAAITKKTKAIVPVHYAGISCEMDEICNIAKAYKLFVIEDAAHGVLANWKNRPVGSKGDLSALSFHETKNVISGEGGALLINNPDLVEKAHIVWEKGTNRREFMLGFADKYTWKELGSSFPPSELTAAFLWAQIQKAENFTRRRVAIWERYNEGLQNLELEGRLQRPFVPQESQHNGHIYYIMLNSRIERDSLIDYLAKRRIGAVFHYVPLHSSPAGVKYGRSSGDLKITDSISERLLRLPIWAELCDSDVDLVISEINNFFSAS